MREDDVGERNGIIAASDVDWDRDQLMNIVLADGSARPR